MSARSRKSKAAETQSTEDSSSTAHSRSVVVERSRVSTSNTPQRSFSRMERSHSPLSISRTEEKDELCHLNDRLAGYIDYVRKLELDKEHLTRRIHAVTEERMGKIEDARKTYEDEITALRNLIDELASQKGKLELEAKQAKEDASDARMKLSKRDHEVRTLNRRIDALEKELTNFKDSHDRYPSLLSDHRNLEKRFEEVKKELDSETLLRTDLENKMTGLKEQLDFRSRLFDEERDKMLEQKVYIEEEVEGRKQVEYECRLADELSAVRQQMAEEMEEYKIQIEDTFEKKMTQLRSSADHSDADAGRNRTELMTLRKRVDEVSHNLDKKTAEVDILKRRVAELEKQLDEERRDHDHQITYQRDEVRRLKEQLEESFREFTDLMNTKIALDREILMYRKMLEGEESRLNIQSPDRADSQFMRTGKRRHESDEASNLTGHPAAKSAARYAYKVSATSTGPLEFYKEQDTSGKWIKLFNPTTEDVHVGSWELVHQCEGEETRYKFHHALIVKPGTTCTIWSSDTDTTHNPPTDIVMKNKSFVSGPDVSIQLIDSDGTEQAKCAVKRERVRASAVHYGRKLARGASDEKCMVM